jgi:predicted Zn finger-like uncharacterized protein
MIITCPQCSTQYAVPSEAIPPQGKKVKCTACQHIWMQKPLEAMMDTSVLAPPPETTEPIPANANLPAIPPPPSGVGMKLAFGIFALFALVSVLLANHSLLPKLDNLLGMESTDGVVFRNFSVEKKRVENKLEFKLAGDIVNTTDSLKPLGIIRIRVLSSGGREMGKLDFQPEVDSLMPGETYHIAPAINNVSGNADKLVLDMGNKWEMMFR